MFMLVVGGGRVGAGLTKLLIADGHEVALIERNRSRYDELFREFGDAVHLGDGADADVLREAGANRADVVAAVADHDEDNLVICQLVKLLFMMPKTIARVTDPGNEPMFTAAGVDGTVNSTRIINQLIGEKVRSSEVMPILPLKGDVEIVEARVPEDSAMAGKTVKSLPLSNDCRVIALARGDEVILADPGTVIQADDLVYVLTRRGQIEALRKLV